MSLPDSRKKPLRTDFIFSAEQLRDYRGNSEILPPELYAVIRDWKERRPYFTFKTSGSTGAPKDLAISRERILLSAKKTIDYLDLKPGITTLLALKLDYIAGFMQLIRTLEAGMDLHYFQPISDPFEHLNSHRNYFVALVPLQVRALLKKKFQIRNFHSMIIGGAALNTDLRKKVEHLPYPVYETYGMTETVSHIALKRLNGADKHDNFHILGDVKIKSNKNGCLAIKADVTEGKWVQTNDVVMQFSETEFDLLGRLDDVINSGGIKIHPLRIEEEIRATCPDSFLHREFAVVGKKDQVLGEKAVLVFQGPSFETFELEKLQNCLLKIDKYSRPKEILFLPKFERTNSGKLKRSFIKESLS